jgi:hypothetical protein
MTTLPEADHSLVEIDSPHWCWSRLTSTKEGILSFLSSGRPVRLAVPYAVDRQQVIIALAPINTAGWRAAGRKATLEIHGTEPDRRRWLVRASGHAHRTTSTERDAALLASPLERPRLASDDAPSELRMPLVYVRGFYEPVVRHPARPTRNVPRSPSVKGHA